MKRSTIPALAALISVALLTGCGQSTTPTATEPAPAEPTVSVPEDAVEAVHPGTPFAPNSTLAAGEWGIFDTAAQNLDTQELLPIQVQVTGVSATAATDAQIAELEETGESFTGKQVGLYRYSLQLLTEVPEEYATFVGNPLFAAVTPDITVDGVTQYSTIGIEWCKPAKTDIGHEVGSVIHGCIVAAWDEDAPALAGLALLGPSLPLGVENPYRGAPAVIELPLR